MESILSPFVPCYSPPSFIVWSLSRVAHDGIHSHYPLSLLKLCQSLPIHPCPLCSNKGSRPSATHYPPISSSSLVSVCQSLYYFLSCLSLGSLISSPMADLLLSTSAYSFQKIGLEGVVPWFQLPLLFGALDQAKGLFIAL